MERMGYPTMEAQNPPVKDKTGILSGRSPLVMADMRSSEVIVSRLGCPFNVTVPPWPNHLVSL